MDDEKLIKQTGGLDSKKSKAPTVRITKTEAPTVHAKHEKIPKPVGKVIKQGDTSYELMFSMLFGIRLAVCLLSFFDSFILREGMHGKD